MQSFFSVDKKPHGLDSNTKVDSPTTVTHSYSPVDLISQLEIYIRESYTKVTELGHLLLALYPNLVKNIKVSYVDKIHRAQLKLSSLLADMNHHNQMLRMNEHLRDVHRHFILEFLGKTEKEIRDKMYFLRYSTQDMRAFLDKNSEHINPIEQNILIQPHEFRLWLFELIKKELTSKNSSSGFAENINLKEYLSKSLDTALGLKDQYKRLFTTKIRKISAEARSYQNYLDDLYVKELRDFSKFKANIAEMLKTKYESISMLQFEFMLFQKELLKGAQLTEEVLANVTLMKQHSQFNAKFNYDSPLENAQPAEETAEETAEKERLVNDLSPCFSMMVLGNAQPEEKMAEETAEEEWFFHDLSPRFSMMVMQSATHGLFVDNDINMFFAARQFYEPLPPRHRIFMEDHILQVYEEGMEDQFTKFRIVS